MIPSRATDAPGLTVERGGLLIRRSNCRHGSWPRWQARGYHSWIEFGWLSSLKFLSDGPGWQQQSRSAVTLVIGIFLDGDRTTYYVCEPGFGLRAGLVAKKTSPLGERLRIAASFDDTFPAGSLTVELFVRLKSLAE